jgi:hypothetical protein
MSLPSSTSAFLFEMLTTAKLLEWVEGQKE